MAESYDEAVRLQAVRRALGALKVFPLHGVAVLPGTPTPLHVFEPRYRALVRDALRGDRVLAVPYLVSAEGLRELHPPVLPVAGVGLIERHEEHRDGRFDIVVRGAARVRLIEELPSDAAYRLFRAELLEDRLPAGGRAELLPELESLRQLAYELATRLPPNSGAAELAEAVAKLEDPSAAADLMAAAALSEPEARQAVLQELDVGRRLAKVISEVASVVLLLARGRNVQA